MGYNPTTGLYTQDSITFVNTREFTRTAQYFKKNGVYTKAHPVYDRDEYQEFWDEEERRRRYGYDVGGVHITGEHYGFLNFAQIERTKNPDDVKGVLKEKTLNARRVGKKTTDFPDFWDGHYHLFTAKKFARDMGWHFLGGKSRRKGFSYVGGWSACNVYDLMPGKTAVIGAFDNKYLLKGSGTMAMAKKYMDFLNAHTDWAKSRIVNTKDHVRSGYKPKGIDGEYGFLSQVISLSFKDNPDASAGKDIYEINLEELGIFPNLAETLGILLPTLEDGDIMTGQCIGWGTGGTKDANWEAFEEIFYNPRKFGFLACENIWDEGGSGTAVGFFYPYVQNYVPYMDKNGNSDKVMAMEAYLKKEAEQRVNASDAQSLQLWRGQRASRPSDAFSRSSSNLFTRVELTEQIRRVKFDENIKYLGRAGKLVRTLQGIRLATNEELQAQNVPWSPPINKFHYDGNDFTGCYIEWQPPYRDPKTGKIPRGLYRVWNDPYAHDKNKDAITLRDSLGATYVYERANPWTNSKGDILIGCYVGRPPTMDEYNMNLMMICEYVGDYDGMLLFENDRGDVKNFFKRHEKYHLLADEPEVVWKKELQSKATGRDKGILMNPNRKGNGAVFLRDWVFMPRGIDEQGHKKLNLHYIYDLPLLEELEKWNLKGNFDRVSCMIVGQFDIKEELTKELEVPQEENEHDFFNRSWF